MARQGWRGNQYALDSTAVKPVVHSWWPFSATAGPLQTHGKGAGITPGHVRIGNLIQVPVIDHWEQSFGRRLWRQDARHPVASWIWTEKATYWATNLTWKQASPLEEIINISISLRFLLVKFHTHSSVWTTNEASFKLGGFCGMNLRSSSSGEPTSIGPRRPREMQTIPFTGASCCLWSQSALSWQSERKPPLQQLLLQREPGGRLAFTVEKSEGGRLPLQQQHGAHYFLNLTPTGASPKAAWAWFYKARIKQRTEETWFLNIMEKERKKSFPFKSSSSQRNASTLVTDSPCTHHSGAGLWQSLYRRQFYAVKMEFYVVCDKKGLHPCIFAYFVILSNQSLCQNLDKD